MKKYLITTILFIFSVQTAFAVTVHTPYHLSMSRYNVTDVEYVLITAETDDEITAEFGLNLILNNDDQVLWHDEDITLEIVNGEINETKIISPTFKNNHKVIYIPLEDDLVTGGTIKLFGLQICTYDWTSGTEYIQVDIDGDLISDIEEGNGYRVTSIIERNEDPPYQIADLEYTINDDDSILFTWASPPDYDYERTTVGKYNTTDDVDSYELEVKSTSGNEYLAENHGTGDSVTYKFYSRDYMSNPSEPVVFTFDLVDGMPIPVEEPAEEPEEEPVEEPVEEPAEEETEEEELSRLLNYYGIRYSIKCMPSGVAVPTNDSACLWARIDLIYAQEVLGESADTNLTDFDIHLMTIRRQYPEARYLDNCVDASEPASYCTALGKAMDRVSYFLD